MPSSQEDASPIYFTPKGLSDTLDSTKAFPGAMASLQNLVFDPSTADLLQCRPAGIEKLKQGFPNPVLSFGFVSVFKIVGDVLYGMVASRLTPGYDQPFAFNLLTGTVILPTGVTALNVPLSPAVSGAWTPPTMDVVGTKVVVTHAGFNTGNFATATDTVTFAANPSNGATLTLGGALTNETTPGSQITFTSGTPGAYQVAIGTSTAATLANLLTFLAANGDNNIGQCTYAVAGNVLTISYSQPGYSGNSYPVSASAATVATPTLTGGVGNYFGWFDITNPLAPVWGAGNTAINPLPAVPAAVAQFNDRAYFIVNIVSGQPGLFATDVLSAVTMTNGTYILTFGDSQPLTALAGLPLTNQLGGIIQSLIVFKGVTNMFQVTGDPLPGTAAGAWAKNTLNVATGTLAPRSIVSSPQGLLFMSPQGYRVLDFNANVGPPIGANGAGVSVPFIQCPIPSRVAAACNASLLRVSLGNAKGQLQEFWFDLVRNAWTGPHTLPANMIQAYNNTFIMAPMALPNSLWQSDWLQNGRSTFSEAGLPMAWAYQTSMLPDTQDMLQHEAHEMVVSISNGNAVNVLAADEGGNVISSASIAPQGNESNWDDAIWASSLHYEQPLSLGPAQVPWPDPVDYGRLTLQLSGVSDSFTRIGSLQWRQEELGYLPQAGVTG